MKENLLLIEGFNENLNQPHGSFAQPLGNSSHMRRSSDSNQLIKGNNAQPNDRNLYRFSSMEG